MGCRKNAYRALTELSEWMEDQKIKADEAANALQEKQRSIWTPTHLYDTCCVPWIVDGTEISVGGRVQATADVASRGCNGACGKQHVRLLFEWCNGQAMATAVPPMDPIIRYLDDLCIQGLAMKLSTGEVYYGKYQLKGYLHEHLDRFEQTTPPPFGRHLIKVKSADLTASQRAHQRDIEATEQQAAKRQKRRDTAAGDLTPLLEQVLDICYHHSLKQHLTVADIAWMRLTCPCMARIAARLAREHLMACQLSYSILLNGKRSFGETSNEVDNPRRPLHSISAEQVGQFCQLKLSEHVEDYYVLSSQNRLKALHQNDDGDDVAFVPATTGIGSDGDGDASSSNVSWESRSLMADDETYQGHLIRIYLQPYNDNNNLPEKHVLFCGSQKIEIARIRWDPRCTPEIGPAQIGKLKLHVHECVKQQQLQQQQDDNNNIEMTNSFRGRFSIKQYEFNFGDLVGIYVRKKLPQARRLMQDKRRFPISRAEKLYVKALAKAAREAPGNACDFYGFEGWL